MRKLAGKLAALSLFSATIVSCGAILGIDDLPPETDTADGPTKDSTTQVDADGALDVATTEGSADADAAADVLTDAATDGPPDCGANFDGAADPANCGECGHDCRGSGCSGGLCQPTVLKTSIQYSAALTAKNGVVFYGHNEGHRFTDDGGPEQTSAAWGCGGVGQGFGFDTAAVYFVCNAGAGSVNRATFGGTSASMIEDAGGYPYAVDVDDTNAYWGTDDGRIQRTLKTSGGTAALVVTTGSAPRQLQVRGNYIYWREQNPVIRRIASSSSGAATPAPLANDSTMRFFAVDDAHIYYTTTIGSIKRLDLDGSNGGTLVTGDGSTRLDAIFVDATHVYWTTERGFVRRARKTDGSQVVTVASIGADAATSSDPPIGVASSGDWIFYLESDPGVLRRVAR